MDIPFEVGFVGDGRILMLFLDLCWTFPQRRVYRSLPSPQSTIALPVKRLTHGKRHLYSDLEDIREALDWSGQFNFGHSVRQNLPVLHVHVCFLVSRFRVGNRRIRQSRRD